MEERERERKRGINEEGCGILDILEEKIFWEFGGREEGKKKKKGKGKRICKRENIFSNLKNENIENTDSRV